MLIDDATRVRAERVAACDYALTAHPLTADVARYRAARRPPAPGWVDHTSLGEPGDYLVGDAILDTRSLVVRPVPPDPTAYPVQEVPPLGLSPDRRSVVRLVRPTDAARSFALGVTDVVAARSYHLPLDPLRMRFASEKVIDPGWVAHHFEWTRGADGVERLTERRLFEPLPFRGTLMPERPGAAAFYSVQPAGDALRDALRDALGKLVQEEFDGERLPSHANREGWRLRIGDTIVDVASVVGGDEPFVAISVEAGTDERHLVPRIAARVDGALATGRYDALFVRP